MAVKFGLVKSVTGLMVKFSNRINNIAPGLIYRKVSKRDEGIHRKVGGRQAKEFL